MYVLCVKNPGLGGKHGAIPDSFLETSVVLMNSYVSVYGRCGGAGCPGARGMVATSYVPHRTLGTLLGSPFASGALRLRCGR